MTVVGVEHIVVIDCSARSKVATDIHANCPAASTVNITFTQIKSERATITVGNSVSDRVITDSKGSSSLYHAVDHERLRAPQYELAGLKVANKIFPMIKAKRHT